MFRLVVLSLISVISFNANAVEKKRERYGRNSGIESLKTDGDFKYDFVSTLKDPELPVKREAGESDYDVLGIYENESKNPQGLTAKSVICIVEYKNALYRAFNDSFRSRVKAIGIEKVSIQLDGQRNNTLNKRMVFDGFTHGYLGVRILKENIDSACVHPPKKEEIVTQLENAITIMEKRHAGKNDEVKRYYELQKRRDLHGDDQTVTDIGIMNDVLGGVGTGIVSSAEHSSISADLTTDTNPGRYDRPFERINRKRNSDK